MQAHVWATTLLYGDMDNVSALETRSSDPIHHVHTHTQTYVSPLVSEFPLSVAQEQHPSGTCTQEVENIISLEEQSRDSTIQMY